jgi:pyridoxal 5'-phosphate synthase pdxT subunit
MKIGVLALQGGFAPHVEILRAIGHDAREVRTERELAACEGLVLCGGESTAQLLAIEREPGLREALDTLARSGAPVFGTCAGLILCAREVIDPAQESFGWIDAKVRRNAYGRQLASGEAICDDGATRAILIRAPRIARIGANVHVELSIGGEPVLIREGRVFGASFHPELSGDGAVHAKVFGNAR